MEFLKKHYEKIILSVVLLLVAVMAFFLIVEVGSVSESLKEQLAAKTLAKKAPLKPYDLTTNEATLAAVAKPGLVVLAGPDHNTFNSTTWRRGQSGLIEPSAPRPGVGPEHLQYRRANPLYLDISFSSVAGTSDAPRYQFSITREYERTPNKRRTTANSLTAGTQNDLFLLKEVKGPKEEPTEFVCELLETRQTFSVTKAKPFRKVMGFSADLRYEADRKDLPQKRVDENILLSGVSYKIVAITDDELVISAPNFLRTTILLSAAQ
jgi:hypothetical protein